jgi:rhodanese-related sulfurtransferase
MHTDYFKGKGFIHNNIRHLSPSEAQTMCHHGAMIIDVRENYHSFLHTFDVAQVYYCPASELEAHLDKVPDRIAVIIADAAGLKSLEAIRLLQEKGFGNLANLAGGLLEWTREGYPVISDKKERMSGSCMCMLKYREIPKLNLPNLDPGKTSSST